VWINQLNDVEKVLGLLTMDNNMKIIKLSVITKSYPHIHKKKEKRSKKERKTTTTATPYFSL
jgi:hypothetical protein